jgi:PiT family inorganic phosphate transporter
MRTSFWISPQYARPGVTVADAKAEVSRAVKSKTWNGQTTVALQHFIHSSSGQITEFPTLEAVPMGLISNIRNDIYLIGEALKLIDKNKLLGLQDSDLAAAKAYHSAVDNTTKFIPLWVEVAVALFSRHPVNRAKFG